ncbi:hypothetical protein ANTQUA_LOCUS7787 [Anthophora quadrimaculata]
MKNLHDAQIHQGTTTFTSFYLFFAGTFLLTMSCTLLSSGVWSLLVRLPVVHLVHGPARILVALTGYTVATAVFMLPASCILYKQHNVTQRRRPLLQVIALLSICTIFLTCCASHAIVYRKSAYSDLEDSVTEDSDPASISPISTTLFATVPASF